MVREDIFLLRPRKCKGGKWMSIDQVQPWLWSASQSWLWPASRHYEDHDRRWRRNSSRGGAQFKLDKPALNSHFYWHRRIKKNNGALMLLFLCVYFQQFAVAYIIFLVLSENRHPISTDWMISSHWKGPLHQVNPA